MYYLLFVTFVGYVDFNDFYSELLRLCDDVRLDLTLLLLLLGREAYVLLLLLLGVALLGQFRLLVVDHIFVYSLAHRLI